MYVHVTNTKLFHGMLSLLVARPQSLKLLETGSRNKFFQFSWEKNQGRRTSATGWVSWEDGLSPSYLTRGLGMLGLLSCSKEVSDTLILLGAKFVVRGLVGWSGNSREMLKSSCTWHMLQGQVGNHHSGHVSCP